MAFCMNCGAQLSDGVKFCDNCGTPVRAQQSAQPAQGYNAPAQPAQGYNAPAQPAQGYNAPAQPAQGYNAPAQPAQGYNAPAQPAQGYNAPAQPAQGYNASAQPAQGYNAPAQGYNAPAQPAQGYNAPAQPAQGYNAPAQPAQKKPFNWKILLIIGGAALVVALAVVLIVVFVGKKSDNDDMLGTYYGTTCSWLGLSSPFDGSVTLDKDGKGTIILNGETTSITWKLSGKRFTLTMNGEDCSGTLKDDVLVIDVGGVGIKYTFVKSDTKPVDPITAILGKYYMVSGEEDGTTVEMHDGYIELLADGTGSMQFFDETTQFNWTFEDDVLTITVEGESATATIADGVMTLSLEESLVLVFDKSYIPVEPTAQPVSDDVRTGAYVISAYSYYGVDYSTSELEDYGMSHWYIWFKADGTGVFNGGSEFDFTWADGNLTIPDFWTTDFTYYMEDDTITISSDELTIGFEYYGEEPPVNPFANSDETLSGWWYGWVKESESWGGREDAFYDAWFRVATISSGKYMEVYYIDKSENYAIVSMYIDDTTDDRHCVPVIGYKDAWVFETYLSASDTSAADAFTFSVADDGSVSFSYDYVNSDGSSGCYVEFFFRKEGAPWNTGVDILPPGYDDYIIGGFSHASLVVPPCVLPQRQEVA